MAITNDRLAALVFRMANNAPARWYADAKGDQSCSHCAIEYYVRPGEDMRRAIEDLIAYGFKLVSSRKTHDFDVYRFECERDLPRG